MRTDWVKSVRFWCEFCSVLFGVVRRDSAHVGLGCVGRGGVVGGVAMSAVPAGVDLTIDAKTGEWCKAENRDKVCLAYPL